MNLKMNLIYIDFIHCTTIFIRSYTLIPIVLCLGNINKRIFLQLLLRLVQIVDHRFIEEIYLKFSLILLFNSAGA